MFENEREKRLFDVLDLAIFNKEVFQEYGYHNELQFSFEKEIKTDEPIVIIFSSDVHFGSIYTDYEKLKAILKTILHNDGVYLIINGDYIDNFELPVPKLLLAGINSQLLTPAMQRQWYLDLLTLLAEKRKLLAVATGNHEDFTNNEYILALRNKDVPVSTNRMLLKLKVGATEYEIALVHKSRFNSTINPIHSSHRELLYNFPTSDVICTSHTHLPSIAVLPYPKSDQLLERVLIKTGTLKNKDNYTFKYFNPYNVSDKSTPAVIFYTNKRKMIPFDDFEVALNTYKTLISQEV